MNKIQKIIFFIGLLVFVTSIVFIPIRVKEYEDGEIKSEWLEYKFILNSATSDVLLTGSETTKSQIDGFERSSSTFTKIADQKFRAIDYQTWVIILFAELILFSGLIFLAKSKRKEEE